MGYLGQDRNLGTRTYWLHFRTIVGAFVFIGLVVSAVGVWQVGFDARKEIDNLAVANAESSQWALSQSEVEVLKLRGALLDAYAIKGTTALPEVRRRFDILYSRMNVLAKGEVFATMRATPEVNDAIMAVRETLDGMIPVIDGSDAALIAELLPLINRTEDVAAALRFVSLYGVQDFSQLAVNRRQDLAAVLFDLAIFATALVALVLIVLATLLVQLLQTRRARAESAAAEDRLRAVVETAIDAVVVMDRNGRLLDYNGAAEAIFGYTKTEAIGRPVTTLILPSQTTGAAKDGGVNGQHPRTWLAGPGIVQMQARGKSGRRFPVEVATATASSPDGEIFVSFMRDISNRVAAEQELVDARDRALAGERAKSDLLAVMSHEMRTPINGIMGSLEILADSDLDTRQRRFLDAMQTSGNMLLRHVNAVLDISKIDAGSLETQKREFAPCVVVSNVIRSLEGQAIARGNALGLNVLTPDVGICWGDADSLEQILTNLIGNAIKFTENGDITVEIERMPDSDEVEFRVADTGIGIAADDFERVFSEFVTLDASYARNVEGSGLGLAIARRLSTMMQGEIGVESEPGEGSVFWVRLPLPKRGAGDVAHGDAPETTAAKKANAQHDLEVLLVEDNQINRLVAREMLGSLGCRVTEAQDGAAALELAGARAFDLILMDISMPRMNGLEAATKIRKQASANASTPIVAMTAHVLPDDVSQFIEAGMAEVVVKPISKAVLSDALTRSMRNARTPKLAAKLTAPQTDQARTELVDTLGAPEAARITKRARDEIARELAQLVDGKAQGSAADQVARIHQLAGLAAVVGLSDLRAELIAAQTAAKDGDGVAARTRLAQAQQLLQETA